MRAITARIICSKIGHFGYDSIICWNYLYLARQVDKTPNADVKGQLLDLIAAHSPMSWAHINMLGEYDVSEEKLRDTLGIVPTPPEKAT